MVTRRHVVRVGAGVMFAGVGLRTGGVLGQTPSATPAGVEFPADTVPTVFGDIAIPEKVERVIAITDGAVDALFSLGIVPTGVTASSNGESVADYLKDDAPDGLVYVGSWGELDVEALVGLDPDVILGDRYTLPEVYEQLSAIAPVICPLEIEIESATSVQQWEYEALVWGHALRRQEQAQQLIDEVRQRATGIESTLGDQAGASVVVFRPQPEFPVVMSHNWITGRMLTWSGLSGNEFTEKMPPPHSGSDVSLEQLDLLNADWYFFAARDAEMAASIENYVSNPLFQTLDGYKSGQMAQVDGAMWSGATGMLASHAMLDDIERIIVRREGLYGS